MEYNITQTECAKVNRMNPSQLIESRMGRKVLAAVENLIKAMRNPGPFGGFQSEAVSIKAVLKRAEEEVYFQESHSKKSASFVNSSKVIKVFLEDKYLRHNRTLVEQYIVETLEIPDNLNGFEYLFYPHLEKPETLSKFFDSWLSTTLNSLYYLLEGVALSRYFLTPVSDEELEVANELRKRYNLVVETEEFDLRDGAETKKHDKTLENLYKTRHYIHKLLIKKRIYILKNYKEIIEEIRQARVSPSSNKFQTTLRHINSQGTLANIENRRRFFSGNDIGVLGANSISPMHEASKASGGGNQSSGRVRMSSDELSLDLSASSSISNRPFKLQESLIEQRVLLHRRKISVDSHSMFKRTGTPLLRADSHTVDLAEEMGLIEYVLSQKGEDTRETTSRFTAEDDSHGTIKKTSHGRTIHRKSSTGASQLGLASIGSQLLKSGTITDDHLELDEDDRLMELVCSIEESRSAIHSIQKTTAQRENPHSNAGFKNSRVVFNMSDPKNACIDHYDCLGDWLIEMQKASVNLK